MTTFNIDNQAGPSEDAVVAAIKTVMADHGPEQGSDPVPAKGSLSSAQQKGSLPQHIETRDQAHASQADEDQNASRSVRLSSILQYRPDRTRVLVTSLVLLLLLKPYFVIGWAAAVVTGVVVCYVVWGSDVFWWRVLSGYRWMKRRFPRSARRLRVRGYVLAKRWNRGVRRLPPPLANALKSPDLRAMAAADAAHHAVLSARLSRLG